MAKEKTIKQELIDEFVSLNFTEDEIKKHISKEQMELNIKNLKKYSEDHLLLMIVALKLHKNDEALFYKYAKKN